MKRDFEAWTKDAIEKAKQLVETDQKWRGALVMLDQSRRREAENRETIEVLKRERDGFSASCDHLRATLERCQDGGKELQARVSRAEERANASGLECISLTGELAEARAENGAQAALIASMLKPDPATITRVVGQAWCRTTERFPNSPELVDKNLKRMVLCAIHQNLTTGETTYVPISFDDLPKVTEAAAR